MDPQAQAPSSARLPALSDTLGSPGSQATHVSVPPACDLGMITPPVSIIHEDDTLLRKVLRLQSAFYYKGYK